MPIGVYTRTEKHRLALRSASKENRRPNSGSFKPGQVSPRKGFKLSQEQITKMRAGLKAYWTTERRAEQSERAKRNGHLPMVGVATRFKKGTHAKTSPRWKGGTHGYWNEEAKKRDGNRCTSCGESDPAVLTVDHRVPRSVAPELRNTLANLVTLCANCHLKKTRNEMASGVYPRSWSKTTRT